MFGKKKVDFNKLCKEAEEWLMQEIATLRRVQDNEIGSSKGGTIEFNMRIPLVY